MIYETMSHLLTLNIETVRGEEFDITRSSLRAYNVGLSTHLLTMHSEMRVIFILTASLTMKTVRFEVEKIEE